jgi:hypothetical protein
MTAGLWVLMQFGYVQLSGILFSVVLFALATAASTLAALCALRGRRVCFGNYLRDVILRDLGRHCPYGAVFVNFVWVMARRACRTTS